jgi:hypothetical protein
MAASTNATTVFYGTAWTSDTLLARAIQHLRRQEAIDGVRRVFVYDADEVSHHLPAYGRYLAAQVQRLGRDHPLIRTQYYLEPIDGEGGLFPAHLRALMRGQHPRRHEPQPVVSEAQGARRHYALLLDVAGEEEGGDARSRLQLANPRRDATALTVVEVEPRPGDLPRYRCVDRRLWLGTRHTALHSQILALAGHWRAQWIVVDATGIGAGLASFLRQALGDRVLAKTFTAKLKSDLGWRFLGAVETGRYQDYNLSEGEALSADTRQFWYEVERCEFEILPGHENRMRWGVWEPPSYGDLVARGHDDLLVSASLCVLLDDQPWPHTGPAAVVPRLDPLDEIDRSQW